MIAPSTPAAHGHLLRYRATIKAPVKLSPHFLPKKRTSRPTKAGSWPTGAKVTKPPRAKATAASAAAKGRSKKPAKTSKHRMVLTPTGGK
ncbi:hypothetical protein BZA05DRAFT_442839 [Tricharina praecox]|uniref:uncharacterized protein n=1 Tax=Tricharina praecox TaxID=43433 RepID=UPI00221F2C14|nr:uncharacterized protein BZA05DRAFT_442839 [Tricharina praecox]KAI5855177.1 hypothetical protein BZA05DRAFT_442839 [Tricharina praecox]